MSENKHTPGPWEAQWTTETHSYGHFSGPLGWNIFHRCEDGLLDHVAELPDVIRREANAQLIAAAPELLNVLQQCVSAIGDELAANSQEEVADHPVLAGHKIIYDNAKALISKIESGGFTPRDD
jgi:hypothetical protein